VTLLARMIGALHSIPDAAHKSLSLTVSGNFASRVRDDLWTTPLLCPVSAGRLDAWTLGRQFQDMTWRAV
jgi:hypothetical protein